MSADPADLLRQFFPRDLLNFDVPPAGMSIGPLHAIFAQAGQMLANFQADELLLAAQLSVQNAAGPYLDKHGLFYATPRRPSETDEPYRARILLAPTAGKLTIPAITKAVQTYYAGATYPHAVFVFDRQSQRVLAAGITYVDPGGTTVVGLQNLDFVIAISVAIPASLTFFAGRSYAGRNSYVLSTAPQITTAPSDLGLVADVLRTKAGGTLPIYEFTRVITAGE